MANCANYEPTFDDNNDTVQTASVPVQGNNFRVYVPDVVEPFILPGMSFEDIRVLLIAQGKITAANGYSVEGNVITFQRAQGGTKGSR